MRREAEWAALDRAHVWHPYTQHGLAADAVPVVRGDGAYLELADGRRILDAVSSWWTNIHGHAHPVIARAVADPSGIFCRCWRIHWCSASATGRDRRRAASRAWLSAFATSRSTS